MSRLGGVFWLVWLVLGHGPCLPELPAQGSAPLGGRHGAAYRSIMIIWRGWSVLSVFITLLIAGIVASSLNALLGSDSTMLLSGYGLGLLLAGLANYFFGRQVNAVAPAKKVEAIKEQMRHEMWNRVAQGTFQITPGAAPPATREEAHQRVESSSSGSAPTVRRVCVISTFFSSSRSSGSGAAEGVLAVVLVVLSVVLPFTG